VPNTFVHEEPGTERCAAKRPGTQEARESALVRLSSGRKVVCRLVWRPWRKFLRRAFMGLWEFLAYDSLTFSIPDAVLRLLLNGTDFDRCPT
jgi:hypothetical protein